MLSYARFHNRIQRMTARSLTTHNQW